MVLAGREKSAMEESASRITTSGGRAEIVVGDVRDPGSIQSLVAMSGLEADVRAGERLPDEVLERAQEVLSDIMIKPENFYNRERRHSSLNYLTPNEFEDLHSPKTRPNSHKPGLANGVKGNWRREWDLNPRWASPRRFSRPVHSSALSSLRGQP